MGLDFSHGEAQWSYGGFMSFRKKLAKEIGMTLEEMEGFVEGGKPFSDFKDDIVLLLDHSDCDGHLTPGQCKKIIPRLQALTAKWPDTDWDKGAAQRLIESMQEAIEAKENLEFR